MIDFAKQELLEYITLRIAILKREKQHKIDLPRGSLSRPWDKARTVSHFLMGLFT